MLPGFLFGFSIAKPTLIRGPSTRSKMLAIADDLLLLDRATASTDSKSKAVWPLDAGKTDTGMNQSSVIYLDSTSSRLLSASSEAACLFRSSPHAFKTRVASPLTTALNDKHNNKPSLVQRTMAARDMTKKFVEVRTQHKVSRLIPSIHGGPIVPMLKWP